MKAFSLSFVLFLIGTTFSHAQHQGELVEKTGDCSGFHGQKCKMPDAFEKNGQSKSALMSVSDTSVLSFVAYSGHDYYIGVCKQEVLSNEIHFKIKDTEMVKDTTVEIDSSKGFTVKDTTVSYKKKTITVWDNQDHDNTQKLEFANPDNSRRLKIWVATKGESNKSSKLKTREMGCVGVLIGHAPTRDTGF